MDVEDTYDWIIEDMSYKAPEQMQEMICERWFPMIMDAVASERKGGK